MCSESQLTERSNDSLHNDLRNDPQSDLPPARASMGSEIGMDSEAEAASEWVPLTSSSTTSAPSHSMVASRVDSISSSPFSKPFRRPMFVPDSSTPNSSNNASIFGSYSPSKSSTTYSLFHTPRKVDNSLHIFHLGSGRNNGIFSPDNRHKKKNAWTKRCNSIKETSFLVLLFCTLFSAIFVVTYWISMGEVKDLSQLRGAITGTNNVPKSVCVMEKDENKHGSDESNGSSSNKCIAKYGNPYQARWYSPNNSLRFTYILPFWAKKHVNPYRVPREKRVCLVLADVVEGVELGEPRETETGGLDVLSALGNVVGCALGFDMNCNLYTESIEDSNDNDNDGDEGEPGNDDGAESTDSATDGDGAEEGIADDEEGDEGTQRTRALTGLKKSIDQKNMVAKKSFQINKYSKFVYPTAPGNLPTYTTNLFHNHVYNCYDDSAFYLFVVRNPLDRIGLALFHDDPSRAIKVAGSSSAGEDDEGHDAFQLWEQFKNKLQPGNEQDFYFRKRLHWDCRHVLGSTLDEMIQNGLRLESDSNNSNAKRVECQRRFRESLLGTEHAGSHSYFNYQYYWEGLPRDAREEGNGKILIIRSEHLVDDWNSVEIQLGGSKRVLGTSTKPAEVLQKYKYESIINAKKVQDTLHSLSKESRQILCNILCNEIQTYKHIIQSSTNLSPKHYGQSISELKQSCPTEIEATSCPLPKPDITQKLITNRGYENHNGYQYQEDDPEEDYIYNTFALRSHLNVTSPTILDNQAAISLYNVDIDSESPYENHMGGDLPIYMKKHVDMYLKDVPSDKRVCLVHVGKSAGTTVACAMGFNAACGDAFVSPGLLPQFVTRRFHAQIYDCIDDSAYFLYVVRNPLERLVSAFNYDKPVTPEDWKDLLESMGKQRYQMRKKLYVDCPFDSIEDLAQLGLSPHGNATEECKQRAMTSVDGTHHFGTHSYFNFQYHLEGIPKGDAKLMVLRTEHLAEDWNSAELEVSGMKEILGPNQTVLVHRNVNMNNTFNEKFRGFAKSLEEKVEKGTVDFGHHGVNGGEKDKFLSEESRMLLCERLCNEIQVYKRILHEAINLNENQVQVSLSELKESCPLEAEASTCKDPLPNIGKKLAWLRGYDEGMRLEAYTGEISVGRGTYPSPPSPYELIWPNLTLPYYMRKDMEYDIKSVPADKKSCLVHVGKTAGSTIGCKMGFNLHCGQNSTGDDTPGLFPQYVTNNFHAQIYDCDDLSAYFVFVIRNPLQRLISAFNYELPKAWPQADRKGMLWKKANSLYTACSFNTIDDLALQGLSSHGNATVECQRRAKASVLGTELFGSHAFFNYQYHLEAIPKGGQIMSIRTEHLVDDWNSVEYTYGGEKNIVAKENIVFGHNNEHSVMDEKQTYLCEESRSLLCENLCNEIQVYKRILQLSVNLNKEQVSQSMDELKQSCPIEASATACADPMPDITQKLVNNRGYLKENNRRE